MNVPNALTVLRMLLIPVYVYVYVNFGPMYALPVFVIASLTDIADGYIARKYNQITNFGKLMDPLADKLMTLTVLFMLCRSALLPFWMLIVMIAKELVMVLGAAFLLKGRKIVVMANWMGKAATFSFFAALVIVSLSELAPVLLTIGHVLAYLAIAISIAAMVGYAWGYLGGHKSSADKPGTGKRA